MWTFDEASAIESKGIMRNSNLRFEIKQLILNCCIWLFVVVVIVILGFFGNDWSSMAMTAALVPGLGINIARLLLRQQDRIEALETQLSRFKVRSLFAYAEPMIIDDSRI